MTFLCCENTKRIGKLFRRKTKTQPLPITNAATPIKTGMTSSTASAAVAPPPYKEEPESLKSF
ncbi:hypothetical protein BGX29_010329 [Mortierella sp. GBA35]|nr:hypothetical protein BGX29_010329 [Mortierella sp. GBA35]